MQKRGKSSIERNEEKRVLVENPENWFSLDLERNFEE
jgi:hypothetical protein